MKSLKFFWVIALICIVTVPIYGQEKVESNEFKKFYVKPYGGFIGIQDMDLQLTTSTTTSPVNVESGFGYTAGISAGYFITEKISTELGFEYKSNSITTFVDNVEDNGDYASNFIYLNAFYNFRSGQLFNPYIGIGLSLIEEIDIDLNSNDTASFSDSGNIGFQGIAGLDFNFSEKWALNFEMKYVTFSDFDMEEELSDRMLRGLSYNPFIVNIGVKYRF